MRQDTAVGYATSSRVISQKTLNSCQLKRGRVKRSRDQKHLSCFKVLALTEPLWLHASILERKKREQLEANLVNKQE